MNPPIRFFPVIALIAFAAPSKSNAQACSKPYFVEQAFPTTGPEETRWKLCWQVLAGPNLVITGAWFRPAPAAPWIKVIYDARVSQIFVPYHGGDTRFLDIAFGFGSVPLTSVDCRGHTGIVVGANKEVCKEVRDRGIAWKLDSEVRRGQELVLWSVLAAAQYNYIVEWSFRDDGIIVGRVGATGWAAWPETHMHGVFWRLDLDLNGSCCNAASLFKHTETGLTAIDTVTDITSESGFQWDAKSFTMLQLRDSTLKNSNGKNSEWHLMPSVSGTPEHDEAFTKNTFWVTQYRWSEMLADDLPTYVVPAEPVLGRDVVLWYYAGLHHMVRDEDSDMTHVMWMGFMLKPWNVWSKTPLFP